MPRTVLSVVLAVVSALGSAGAGSPARAALRVAGFRCDVTPPLNGQQLLISSDPVKTIEDPLWAKGIVLDDGQQRYVICAVDWCGLCNSSHRLFRGKLASAVGTGIAHVAVQCVHQHTAPYTDGDAQKILDREKDPPGFVDPQFMEAVTDRLGAAAKESLTRLEPFDRVGCGEGRVERIAATRRVRGADGRMQVRYSLVRNPALRDAPEGDIDPMLKTVTLARGDRPLVRLHYYATHPQSFYGDCRVSADFVGFARDRLERKEQALEIYFTGCAGDITVGKYNDGTPAGREGMAQRLQAGMEAAVAATRWEPAAELRWRVVPLRLEARRDDPYAKLPKPAHGPDAIMRERRAGLRAMAQRADEPFELTALSLGHVCLLHLPGECLIEFQHYAQRSAPGRFVAVAAYGDLAPGYVCPQRAFAEGGYEPSASRVAPDTEQRLKAAIRALLDLPADRGN